MRRVNFDKGCVGYDCPGVYCILNTVTGKSYIGSTEMTIRKRLNHHVSLLRVNNHKNTYLQNSWNKHGENNFRFMVLKICYDTLEQEQVWLDAVNSAGSLYNINPLATGTPSMSKEAIKKRADTMRKKYASGEMVGGFPKGNTPWNKGLTKKDVDMSYLKVPKTLTDKLKLAHKNTSDRNRLKSPFIDVFSKRGELLGTWDSPMDLYEWSMTESNNLPIKSRFGGTHRLGVPVKVLQNMNIIKACKTGKPYKGLYMKYRPKTREELKEEQL